MILDLNEFVRSLIDFIVELFRNNLDVHVESLIEYLIGDYIPLLLFQILDSLEQPINIVAVLPFVVDVKP